MALEGKSHQTIRCRLGLANPLFLQMQRVDAGVSGAAKRSAAAPLGRTFLFDFLRKQQPALAGLRIEDYALIGDCETAALVGSNGSIDWLCWPTFSSPACFASLLGTQENGFWQVAPRDKVTKTTRRYLPGTMIVETTFESEQGAVALIDFMPPRGEASDVVRIVRGLRGKVAMRMELVLRFDYGKTIPWVTRIDDGLRAVAGAEMVVLRTDAKLESEAMKTFSDFW